MTIGKFFVCSLLATAGFSGVASSAPVLNEKPKSVQLKDDLGGRVDGTPWSSEMITGKVWVLFYVDPDHRSKNETLKDALKKEDFPKDKYSTIAVINMAASWVPNGIIASSIKSNQEKFPEVVYVKDLKKTLVQEWQLTDDAYVVLLFDKQGRIIFNREGEFDEAGIKDFIKLIRQHLDD